MQKKWPFAVVASALAVAGAAVSFSCSQTPTSVPVRTFERAQRMDVVCLRIFNPIDGMPIVPEPLPENQCDPVAPGVNGQFLVNQLFAVVTQSTRGEIAVVDLSAGALIDQSRSTPGINFVPVGSLPTDVAVTPDGKMAFVAAQEPNKPAIYGVPTSRIVGDAFGLPPDPQGTPNLTSWPVCALPQNPGAITVVPRTKVEGSDLPPYDIVVVLPGDRRSSAKVVTLDPRPFLRGAAPRKADGTPDLERLQRKKADGTLDETDYVLKPGVALEPGALSPCPILAAKELVGQEALPAQAVPGAPWPNGIPYVDGGAELTCDRPATSTVSCALPACCGDAGAGGSGACSGATSGDGGGAPLDVGTLEPPRLVAIARDDRMIYIADANVPLVHAVDMSSGTPQELPPFIAQSLSDPRRPVTIRDVAVSPPTRDYKRYLYAVDRDEGSLIIYDVTDPKTADRRPLRRPNPQLNPFQPEDRLTFSTPAVAVSFARHDFPLQRVADVPTPSSRTGVLCNPNPNLDANPSRDPGFYYRAGSSDPGATIGPLRLRGIFGFATLANGLVVTIDVDDWDAPCRRPTLLGAPSLVPPDRTDVLTPIFSALPTTQPLPTGVNDLDPYHAPLAPLNAVSGELFFPVSAPHRPRSDSLLSSTAGSIDHTPRLTGTPTLSNPNGTPQPFTGQGSERTPLLLPTGFYPSDREGLVASLGVNFAGEVPDVHIDQDWSLTYEGVIPGFDGISASMTTADRYQTLTIGQPQGRFCLKGVEDFTRGTERALSVAGELRTRGAPIPDRLDRQITDYIQLTEDLLPSDDPYWQLDDLPGDDACWQGVEKNARYDVCARTYGASGITSGAELSPERDLPILEAYEDRLVVSRFFSTSSTTREVISPDPSNASKLKLARCCFHNQARFRVRTGGVWSLVGTGRGGGAGLGFLSHTRPDASGRCVTSCETRQSLLNSRAPATTLQFGTASPPDRNSALALRNPMMSFYVIDGIGSSSPPARDAVFTFSSRGQFLPLVVNVGGTSISVSPQSMRYIESLGQLAVVDGASQGLVLIDLGNVAIARAPYF